MDKKNKRQNKNKAKNLKKHTQNDTKRKKESEKKERERKFFKKEKKTYPICSNDFFYVVYLFPHENFFSTNHLRY